MSLVQSYQNLCSSRDYRIDDQQLMVAQQLDDFTNSSLDTDNRGFYLWGNVGRGKTMLVDLFYEEFQLLPKRRLHFHELIRDIRDLLAEETGPNPMTRVAAKIAPPNRLFCIDELHVPDVDTALVLEIFLAELIRNRLVVVTTSNFSPDNLLGDEIGVSRASIESSDQPVPLYVESRKQILKMFAERFSIVQLEGGLDYRLVKEHRSGNYRLGEFEHDYLESLNEDGRFGVELESVARVFGRPVRLTKRFEGAVSVGYQEICEGLFSYRDYLELLITVDLVVLEDVSIESLDGAKRFGWLVELVYDSGKQLHVSSRVHRSDLFKQLEVPPHLDLEFERVLSRVIELTS